MPGDTPIVVSGGSVTIDFDDGVITKGPGGKHYHPQKKIRRVEVTDEQGQTLFAQDTPSGKVTVTIHIGS